MSILSDIGTKIGNAFKAEKEERINADNILSAKTQKIDENGDVVLGNFKSKGISDTSTSTNMYVGDNYIQTTSPITYSGEGYGRRGDGIASFFTGLNGGTQIHIKTTLRTSHHDMYNFRVEGYTYQAGLPIDIIFAGYAYNSAADVIYADTSSINSIVGLGYIASDGYLVLRITAPTYYTSGIVSTLRVGNGKEYTDANIIGIYFNSILKM